MKNEKNFAAYSVLSNVADDLILDALLPEDRAAAPVKTKKERPRLLAFLESGWGVAIICALVAVSVMGGIIWVGNQPGLVTPPAGTAEPESDPATQEILTDGSEEIPTETGEPETVFEPTEMTDKCTIRTSKERYEWGEEKLLTYSVELTCTVAGAILDISEYDFELVNLATGKQVTMICLTTTAHVDTSKAYPKAPDGFAQALKTFRFDWATTLPGHYRLTYKGVELSEGEEYPYCDFEIYEAPIQTDQHSLTIFYCHDTFLPTHYFAEEQGGGGTLSDTVYEREMTVEENLGIDLLYHDGGNWLNYSEELTASVLSGDDKYAVVMTHNVYGITSLMTSAVLMDLASMNDRQEIHLNADYWDKAMMEDVSLGGHLYVGYNDFLLPNHHMVVFNKSLYEPYVATEGNLYDHVREGNWTLERMSAVSNLVNGQDDSEDKVYGFGSFGGQQLFAFVPAGGVKMVDKRDDGVPYVSGIEDPPGRWVSLTEWVHDLCTAENAYDWQENLTAPNNNRAILSSGRVLLSLTSTSEYMCLENRAETYGVLPYPKYDTEQTEYRTLYYGGMLGVVWVNRDTSLVGRTLELLARHAQPVQTAYDEELLGTSAAKAPDDIQMLSIMEDTLISDLTYIAYDDLAYSLFNCMFLRLTEWEEEHVAEQLQKTAQSYEHRLRKLHDRLS